jgi:hypothetical protein
LKFPVVGFGMASSASAIAPPESFIVMMTPVFGPGAGEIVPDITMGWMPEYEDKFVLRVMVYVAAYAGTRTCDARKTNVKRLAMRAALLRRDKTLYTLGSHPLQFKICRCLV